MRERSREAWRQRGCEREMERETERSDALSLPNAQIPSAGVFSARKAIRQERRLLLRNPPP